ncbi:MAG: efflux RND transporter periplasmic adaptor subunit [Deltaproteobacteria bacterium]|nr:efflux RND transporter periplasmic adaptor subunit [Deltaproteobacteria bacterium]
MKLGKSKHIIIALCVIAGVVSLGMYSLGSVFPGKTRVEHPTSKVVRRDLGATVQATGVVKPQVGAEVKVGSRLPGKVVELPINVGDRVANEQIIARLEQDDLKAKVKLQEAILDENRAELERLDRDYVRDKQLVETKSISDQKFDQTHFLREMVKARVKKAEAELDHAKTQLSYANIAAPIKGTVAEVATIQGETVTTGLNAPTFIKIIDLERLEVRAYVDENDIGRVRVGQDAIYTVASYPGTEFKGAVTSIYPSATIQDNVVYYITTVSVDNREEKLKPDMTANVLIFLDQRKGVLTVPNKAVQREGNSKFVYVIEGGAPQRRPVGTGWKDSSYTEILDGLREGESVVVGALARK